MVCVGERDAMRRIDGQHGMYRHPFVGAADLQQRNCASLAVVHLEVPEVGRASLVAVVVDADGAFVAALGDVFQLVPRKVKRTGTHRVAAQVGQGAEPLRKAGRDNAFAFDGNAAFEKVEYNSGDGSRIRAGFEAGDGGFGEVAPQNLFAACRRNQQRVFALDTFLDSHSAGQQEVFADGLPGKRTVGHQGVAAEELIDQAGRVIGGHLDELRHGSCYGIGRIGYGATARS